MAEGEERQAAGAIVKALEADPRRSSMYRLVLAPEAGGEDELLSVHEDTLVRLRLLKGRRLSPEEWDELRRSEELEQAYRASLGLLNRKARTRKELEEALKRKSFSGEAIAGCLDRLKNHRLIDDTAYATRFADQKVTYQRKGSRLVRQELLQRGVARNDVEQALSSLDAEAERASALALARKRWPGVKGESRREREYKLNAVLQRRGFPPGLAREAARQAALEADEEAADGGDDWDEMPDSYPD